MHAYISLIYIYISKYSHFYKYFRLVRYPRSEGVALGAESVLDHCQRVLVRGLHLPRVDI